MITANPFRIEPVKIRLKTVLRSTGHVVHSRLPAYALAIAVTLATLGGHLAFAPWFGDRPVMLLFVLPIVLSTFLGGAGPGLAATGVLALGAVYFLLPPTYSLPEEKPVQTMHWLVLILSGVLISLLSKLLRRHRTPGGSNPAVPANILIAERTVQRSFGLALLLLVVLGVISILSVSHLREQSAWESHTHKVINTLRQVLALTIDIETSARGYILTGREEYLSRNETARRTLPDQLQSLRTLTADNPAQQRQLDLLGPLIVLRLARAEELIKLRRQQSIAAVQQAPDYGLGKQLQDQIRALMAAMEATEQDLLREREASARHISITTRTIVIGGGTLAFVFVALALYLMNKEFAGRHRAEADLSTGQQAQEALGLSNDELERRVAQRTAELRKANEALSAEIHERRGAEKAAAESEERFAGAFAQAPSGVALVSPDGRWLKVNQALCEMVGYTEDELLARTFQDITQPEDLAADLAQVRRLLAGEIRSYQIEKRYVHRRGHLIWVSLHVSLVRDNAGQPRYFISQIQDITGRKANEETLQRQKSELRVLFDLMPAMIWFKDTGNRILRINQRVAESAGKTVAEIEGKHSQEIYPYEAAKYFADDQAVIQTGVPRLGIIELLHDGTGKELWVQTDKVPVRDQVGQVTGIVVMAQDITVRRLAEDSLRRNQALLRMAGRISRLGAWSVDIVERRVTYSDEMCAIHEVPPGYTPTVEEALEYNIPESRQRVAQAFAACARDGTPFDLELQITTARGRLVWVRSMGEAERDAAGVIRRVQGAYQDITERRESAEELRKSEELFKQVVENIDEMFWVTDPATGLILYVSPAYADLWGHSCESLYADPRSLLDSVHPEDRARVQAAREAKQASGDYDEVFRIVRPDQTVRWIHARAYPIHNEAGAIHRIVGVAEDITEYRTMEEQFRQTQKLEAIGTLAGGIAHDFNNILGAIIGYAELAKLRLTGNPTVSNYLSALLQGAHRASALVRQILAFSRQQEQQRALVQLRHVVAEPLALLRATIPSTIAFDSSLASDLPAVLADATQIHQVVMNLCTNAAQAMRDQPGRLEVRLEQCTVDAHLAETTLGLHPGPYVRLTITDTGPGMNAAVMARIFEPFFTTKAPGEGTGLGLAVVHGIMQSHEGAITVESEPGHGTTFRLYFPAQEAPAIPPEPALDELPRGGGEHVLFVDDEKPLAQLGQAMLEELGYVVTASSNPTEALELVRATPEKFALVITDQTMPLMTGSDLAVQILRIRPGLPVILTTGYTASLPAQRLNAVAVRELLLKPLTLLSLGSAVRRALNLKPHP